MDREKKKYLEEEQLVRSLSIFSYSSFLLTEKNQKARLAPDRSRL
jgi:hypothetical protein